MSTFVASAASFGAFTGPTVHTVVTCAVRIGPATLTNAQLCNARAVPPLAFEPLGLALTGVTAAARAVTPPATVAIETTSVAVTCSFGNRQQI